ncbi:hypothetical protein IV203_000767 [Nitzschia inconspicua]|uniref:Alcohol dehydrogenase iron-type/glycerol dehydrogenase GldA domain-containing protein n=1 Tax=Nitzschia inconspicua TaxID=303405 RepID=A0A9K3PQZ9_9STRA|nr:hypothetical protein IV203_000767 [Nitzschia inconspicua]
MTSTSGHALQKLVLQSGGVSSFRQVIQSHLDTLREAPILLISSHPAEASKSVKQVGDACQFAKFTLAQQFGLRTVDTYLSSAFATVQDVEQRLELMQRTGAASIVVVGSGAAMDLGKTLQSKNSTVSTPLLLVPATYGAVLASGASHSLLLDSVEEKLVTYPKQSKTVEASWDHHDDMQDIGNVATTIVAPLDGNKLMEKGDYQCLSIILHAIAAILLDTAIQQSTKHALHSTLVDSTLKLLVSTKTSDLAEATETVQSLLFQSATLLSYGLPGDTNDRSITMALLASLLPTIFPQTHPTTFIASLVPGLVQVLKSNGNTTTSLSPQLQQLVNIMEQAPQQPIECLPKVHEQYEGFSIPDMALSCIEANQEVWNCLDADTNILLQVLQDSLANTTNKQPPKNSYS